MHSTRNWIGLSLAFLLVTNLSAVEPLIPAMKFNEVREVAPGVFFRLSSISATDKSVVFGGSNNIWVVFEDYVAVIDANFPDGAADVVAAIRKTTNKPIRYVFDTHHHGDHAYGNSVFFKEGATVIAQANCARLMREFGPAEFDEAGKGPTGRKDVASSFLKQPGIVFDDRLVLEDGKQRVEFLFLAHGHTAGDAVAWLPKHKILCTGDSCVNGAYNFMGHSDSASWVKALEKMQDLKPEMVCPGHGSVAGPELIQKQKRYFVDLRKEVQNNILKGKDLKAIQDDIKFPWYQEWTGVPVKTDNVEHIFKELTGQVTPQDLLRDLGYISGNYNPEKPKLGWVAPKRILIASGFMPARIAELKTIAPDIEFIPVPTIDAAIKSLMNADAVLGFADNQLLEQGNKLRWVQVGSQGYEKDFLTNAKKKEVEVTSLARAALLTDSNQAIQNLLYIAQQTKEGDLAGKTISIFAPLPLKKLIAQKVINFGLKSIDSEVGLADITFVSLQHNENLPTLKHCLKPGGALIFMGDGSTLNLEALAKNLAPSQPNLVVLDLKGFAKSTNLKALTSDGNATVHLPERNGEESGIATERKWKLLRENVRRFSKGEPLLAIVE